MKRLFSILALVIMSMTVSSQVNNDTVFNLSSSIFRDFQFYNIIRNSTGDETLNLTQDINSFTGGIVPPEMVGTRAGFNAGNWLKTDYEKIFSHSGNDHEYNLDNRTKKLLPMVSIGKEQYYKHDNIEQFRDVYVPNEVDVDNDFTVNFINIVFPEPIDINRISYLILTKQKPYSVQDEGWYFNIKEFPKLSDILAHSVFDNLYLDYHTSKIQLYSSNGEIHEFGLNDEIIGGYAVTDVESSIENIYCIKISYIGADEHTREILDYFSRTTMRIRTPGHYVSPTFTEVNNGTSYQGKLGEVNNNTPTSAASLKNDNIGYNIYPSPVIKGTPVTIELPFYDKVEVYDMSGKLVTTTTEYTVPTGNLSTGLYLFKVYDADGNTFNKKVSVN